MTCMDMYQRTFQRGDCSGEISVRAVPIVGELRGKAGACIEDDEGKGKRGGNTVGS